MLNFYFFDSILALQVYFLAACSYKLHGLNLFYSEILALLCIVKREQFPRQQIDYQYYKSVKNMKTVQFFIVGCIALFFSTTVLAGIDQDDVMVLPIHQTSKFYVSFAQDVEAQKVAIKIKKTDGTLIYADQMLTDQVTKIYDMAEYGKGTFVVEIIGADFKLTKQVEIGKIGKFDAQIVRQQGHVDLIYLSNAQNLDIYFKDEKGNVLYKGTGKFGKYRQAFDIQHLPKGTYTLKVTNGEQVFEEDFEVN